MYTYIMLPVDIASTVKLGEGCRANIEQGRIQKIRGRKNRSKCVCPSVQDIWLSGHRPSLPRPSRNITTTISTLPTVSLTRGLNNIKHGYAGFGGVYFYMYFHFWGIYCYVHFYFRVCRTSHTQSSVSPGVCKARGLQRLSSGRLRLPLHPSWFGREDGFFFAFPCPGP